MKMKALILMISMAVSLPFTGSVMAGELPDGPHVITSGHASIEAPPDLARLSIEVTTSAKTSAQAKSQVDKRVAQYFDFLRKQGIEKKDIDAANIRTQPEYDYAKGNKPSLKGYLATRSVQVTLRDLNKLNDLLDGALAANLNEIRSIELGVAEPEEYRQKARQAAIEDATKRASVLAQGFQSNLGQVYSIRYDTSSRPRPIAMSMRAYSAKGAMAQQDAAETYERQNIHFEDQVDVVFRLQP